MGETGRSTSKGSPSHSIGYSSNHSSSNHSSRSCQVSIRGSIRGSNDSHSPVDGRSIGPTQRTSSSGSHRGCQHCHYKAAKTAQRAAAAATAEAISSQHQSAIVAEAAAAAAAEATAASPFTHYLAAAAAATRRQGTNRQTRSLSPKAEIRRNRRERPANQRNRIPDVRDRSRSPGQLPPHRSLCPQMSGRLCLCYRGRCQRRP